MRRGSSSLLLFTIFLNFAEIAQLVEHNLAKVGVAGPSPVFRSFIIKETASFSENINNEFILKIF